MATINDINNNQSNNKIKSDGITNGEEKSLLEDFSQFMQKRTNVTEEDVDRLMKLFAKFNSTTLWSKVKRDDFTVRRFELGYASDTCCCELTPDAMKRLGVKPDENDDDDDDYCTAIVVKYKNTNFSKIVENADDSWIDVNTILVAHSIKGLTPRVIYLDQDCHVQEFIRCRSYNYDDDCDAETVKQLARMLAQIHCQRLPLSKNSCSVWKFFENFKKNTLLYSDKKVYLKNLQQDTQERKDKYYETLAKMEFAESIKFAFDLCYKVNSPIMLTQGDFNRTNRLVREIRNKDDGILAKKEIFMIDLDNGGYDPRGVDLGRYYSNYKHKEDLLGTGDVASDEEMLIFLTEYRDECIRLCGKQFERDPLNSLEHLLMESKVFTLMIHISDSSGCIQMYKPGIEKADYFLNATVGLYECYQALKRHIMDDGTIAKVLKQKQ